MIQLLPPPARLALARGQEHPDCFVCGPVHPTGLHLDFEPQADGSVVATFPCEAAFEGYKGMIHGGIVACLLDGAMTHCLFAQGRTAVTGDLHVRYRHPLRIGHPATVRAWVTRGASPLFVLAAEVVQLGRVTATAVGKFMLKKRTAS